MLLAASLWPTVGVGSMAAAPNSLRLRATYDVAAYIRWSRGTMTVASTARVTNTTDRRVRSLTFNLVPLVTGSARVTSVSVRGKPVEPEVSGQTIVVPLLKPLAPGARTRVRIRYHATFNAVPGDQQGLLMQRDGVLTAYRWIPWLSRRQPFVAPNFGETWVTAVSPRVSVTLTSREPLVFATSGRRTRSAHGSQTFRATNVRDFNFSASPDYRIKRVRHGGVTLRVFYRTQPAKLMARYAIAALERFSAKVGRYPYPELNVAEIPTGTGMESPALIWVSSTVGPGRLSRLVAHEVAHQWFYALVGNNQASQPFVDEALASYLTSDMFRSFRRSNCRTARLDRTVYEYNAGCYLEIVYVQGARYLKRYREQVGKRAFWTGVSAFYDAYRLRIATTRDLLDALDDVSGFNSRDHADRFPGLYP
jgi:hypothetical protein